VLWGEGAAFCAGWDLKAGWDRKYASGLSGQSSPLAHLDFPDNTSSPPRGPHGPTRLDLSKPVIAAVAGPAVAGGMELAPWCDIRVMEEDAYFGVYCRRWGIPLLDGGTVRLPHLVGQGRALEIIMTGRKVPAEECHRIGACEQIVPSGQSRAAAEALAEEIARFPQECVRADRRSIFAQHGLPVRQAMEREWTGGLLALEREGVTGAGRFTAGEAAMETSKKSSTGCFQRPHELADWAMVLI